MFNGCTEVKHIDFPNLDISYAYNYRKLFLDCKNLEILKLTNLKANNNALELEDNFMTDTDYDWAVLSAPSNVTITTTPSSLLVVGSGIDIPAIFRAAANQAYGTWEAEVSVPEEDDVYQYNYFISLNQLNNYQLYFLSQ